LDQEDGFWAQLVDEATSYSVIVEDNGRVAYAYLIDGAAAIVSDVWLYNHGIAPTSVDWSDVEELPFRNPSEFASATIFQPLRDASEFSVEWKRHLDQTFEASISIRGKLFAVLHQGVAPG
jgi:hypothetical protein